MYIMVTFSPLTMDFLFLFMEKLQLLLLMSFLSSYLQARTYSAFKIESIWEVLVLLFLFEPVVFR